MEEKVIKGKRLVKPRPSPEQLARGFLIFAVIWLGVGLIASAFGVCSAPEVLIATGAYMGLSALFGTLHLILRLRR